MLTRLLLCLSTKGLSLCCFKMENSKFANLLYLSVLRSTHFTHESDFLVTQSIIIVDYSVCLDFRRTELLVAAASARDTSLFRLPTHIVVLSCRSVVLSLNFLFIP